MSNQSIQKVRSGLLAVSAYRHLLAQSVPVRFCALLDALVAGEGEKALAAYTDFFFQLKTEGYMGLGDWLWDAMRFQDSPYGLLCERSGQDAALENVARRDVEAFQAAAELDPDALVAQLQGLLPEYFQAALAHLPRWSAGLGFDFAKLTQSYRDSGCGLFARYRALRWSEGQLWGIAEPDSPQPWELWGYAQQRQQVRDNALALLEGGWVNHVLLYGESGTGKSATVKSLLTQPGMENLRIIEVEKSQLRDIPTLVRLLDKRPQKFILFIDDLAFDADDKAYSQLKTILEGSLEKRPDNVVVYATSNRRNLVKQNFSDRSGDEIDRGETIAEKTSLADRFGVRVAYFALTPTEFWQMVEDLAKVYGLQMEREKLRHKAEQWELRHPGRTPRIAKQFIAVELERQK